MIRRKFKALHLSFVYCRRFRLGCATHSFEQTRRPPFRSQLQREPKMTDHTVETSLRFQAVPTYARLGGVLFLLTIATGGFGEFYAPSGTCCARRCYCDSEQHRRFRMAVPPWLR